MAVVDGNLQMQPGWKCHVNSDGSQIAPVGTPDPTSHGMVAGMPTAPTAALLFMEGPGYACMEHYITRQQQANTGRLITEFDLTPGADFIANAWIKETDTKFTKKGKMFNCSLQRIMATNMIQVSNQAGNWVDTGFIAPTFVAGKPMHHTFIYGFDTAKDLYGIQQVIIGGVSFLMPFQLQDVTDQATTWPDGVIFQNQDQVGPKGGTQRYLLDNLTNTWT